MSVNPDSPWADFEDRLAVARRQSLCAPTLNERRMYTSIYFSTPTGALHDEGALFHSDEAA